MQDHPCKTLFLAERERLMLYARRLTSDYAQANDLIQEAFLRCQHLPISAQPERATLAYLYRIIRNLAYDAARRTRFETTLFINEAAELDVIDEATAGLDELADDERRQQLLMRTLASLPTRTREWHKKSPAERGF